MVVLAFQTLLAIQQLLVKNVQWALSFSAECAIPVKQATTADNVTLKTPLFVFHAEWDSIYHPTQFANLVQPSVQAAKLLKLARAALTDTHCLETILLLNVAHVSLLA